MHSDTIKNAEARQQERINSISQANLSLSDRAGVAMSPRSKASKTSFGSTSSRPHLWLGATAAAGPTTDSAAPASPRGSRRGSTLSSTVGDADVPDSPGPGAYGPGDSSFKADIRKDPSKGASSAFKSMTKREQPATDGYSPSTPSTPSHTLPHPPTPSTTITVPPLAFRTTQASSAQRARSTRSSSSRAST